MKCIILEDEIPAQNVLKHFIEKIPNLDLLETFQTAVNANTFLKNTEVDLVFLDINLPDISGLQFMHLFKNPPAIIITTAYPEHALESFELPTIVDYLVKPFSFDRFFKAIKKIENQFQNRNESLDERSMFLNVDKTLHKLIINDIILVESDRNYITVITTSQKLSFIDSLKNWNDKLPNDRFIQVHKSFIINTQFVNKISGNLLYLSDKKIPIGRTYRQNLLEKLGV